MTPSQMKIFLATIATLILNFAVSAQIPSDRDLLIVIGNMSETNISGIVSNTEPDVQCEIQRKQNTTNWISVGFIFGSETTNWTSFNIKIKGEINSNSILRTRSWKDDGSGLPLWWQLKHFGDIGIDPYGNPMGDGWVNLQKFQSGMDPFKWYEPPKPVFDVKFYAPTNRFGKAVLTWQCLNGTIPDYFLIERANRTLRPMTNDWRFARPNPYGRPMTNRVRNTYPPYGRRILPGQDPFITGPFEVIAQVEGKAGIREYHYEETNVDTFAQPLYRLGPHYSPPPRIELTQVNATAIRKTILPVTSRQTTNGYDLVVMHPIAYGSYLLLVRDKNNPQWRASGYFSAGADRNPIHLHVDLKGMMSGGQSPLAMPVVRFLPDVVKPEFTAGWGRDSDGDGLPDVYEVLVTHTEPDNADTGDSGILDGDKEMVSDGWSNLEKFRLRINPQQTVCPPAPVELKQPTGREIMQALMPKTDISCELKFEIKTNGATDFVPIEEAPWIFYKIINYSQPNDRRNFDLRISWRLTHALHQDNGDFYRYGLPSPESLAPLMEEISRKQLESFQSNLAANPPLSRNDITNRMAAIERAYRQGEIDKGLAMTEMMLLEKQSIPAATNSSSLRN